MATTQICPKSHKQASTLKTDLLIAYTSARPRQADVDTPAYQLSPFPRIPIPVWRSKPQQSQETKKQQAIQPKSIKSSIISAFSSLLGRVEVDRDYCYIPRVVLNRYNSREDTFRNNLKKKIILRSNEDLIMPPIKTSLYEPRQIVMNANQLISHSRDQQLDREKKFLQRIQRRINPSEIWRVGGSMPNLEENLLCNAAISVSKLNLTTENSKLKQKRRPHRMRPLHVGSTDVTNSSKNPQQRTLCPAPEQLTIFINSSLFSSDILKPQGTQPATMRSSKLTAPPVPLTPLRVARQAPCLPHMDIVSLSKIREELSEFKIKRKLNTNDSVVK